VATAKLHTAPDRLGARAAPVPRDRSRLAVAVAAVLAFALVLLSHGLWPGLQGDAASEYLTQGAIQCLHDIGRLAATHACHAYADPLGYPLLSNGPLIYLGVVAMRLPGVGLDGAALLAGATLDAIALAGGYALTRRLGAGRWVALWAATLYLICPTVLGMISFIGTFPGFALLGAYAWADLKLLDTLGTARRRTQAVVVAGYVLVRVLALFLDGYSFVASALVTGCLWLAWALSAQSAPRARRWAGLGAIVAANLVAFLLYTAYSPGTYGSPPLEIFRSMGLDVVTLVEPTTRFWGAEVLGATWDHSALWGDGTNSAYNYLGIACVVLAAYALAGPARRRYAVALGCAGAIALVLSLGPSLKVDTVRPQPLGQATYDTYLMPSGRAAADLPWGGLFTALPGLKEMRASYRWVAVSRFALIVLAALAVTELVRRRRRWRVVAVVAAGLMTLELLPNLPRAVDLFRVQQHQMRDVRAQVVPDLRSVTHPRERVFFLSYDGAYNDYLANYLAPLAQLHAYNAGGDKDVALAMQHWPGPIGAMTAPGAGADAVAAALGSGAVDVVIAPTFHLRWNAYSWPPTATEQSAARRAFAPILADPRFTVQRRARLAAIRLAP
jgi:hypothetical protein